VRRGEINPLMMVPPTSYHYWGLRLGYECWDDEPFVREYLRDNEVSRVRSRPANATVGWTAAVGYGRRKAQAANLQNGVWLK
jgi:hypothetical protein